VTHGILAVVNHLASDSVYRAMIQMKSFLGEGKFQPAERVIAEVVCDTQCVRGIAMLNLALGQTGQKSIGASYLSGMLRTEYDIALFIQFNSISHVDIILEA